MNYSLKEVSQMKPEVAQQLIADGVKKPQKPRRVMPLPPPPAQSAPEVHVPPAGVGLDATSERESVRYIEGKAKAEQESKALAPQSHT